MSRDRTQIFTLLFFLLIITIACEVSFSPFADSGSELSAGDIAATSQIALRTSVAQTVETMGLAESEIKPSQPDPVQQEDDPGGQATLTPLPCNKPNFQSETIPDGTKFDPGDHFTKTWTVRNDGTCSWTADYSLVFKSGDKMGGPSAKSFADTINPGETVTLSLDLTAPSFDGAYTGTWKVRAGDGEEFGNYWVTINVGEPPDESSQGFAVTSVSFTNSDQMKVGFCPHSFNLQAEITVNGKGKVKYHWMISNGFESAMESMNFDSAGTKTAILNKNLACSGTSTCSYTVQLYIDEPNHQPFGVWPIALHCL